MNCLLLVECPLSLTHSLTIIHETRNFVGRKLTWGSVQLWCAYMQLRIEDSVGVCSEPKCRDDMGGNMLFSLDKRF
jgi:hypothetical protein